MINKLRAAFAALVAVTALAFTGQARAVAFESVFDVSNLPQQYAAPYGDLNISLSGQTATITFASETVAGKTYLFGGNNHSLGLNVNSTMFMVSAITGSRVGGSPGTLTGLIGSFNGSFNGYGHFNFVVDDTDGFNSAFDHLSFTLTNTDLANPWGSAADVLDLNGPNGWDAAGHTFVAQLVNGHYVNLNSTGFAAEDANGVVINPTGVPDGGSTLMMLGGVLGALALGSRFRKTALLSLLAAGALAFSGHEAKATAITGDIELGGSVHFNTAHLNTATAVNTWVSDNNNIGFTSVEVGGTGDFGPGPVPLGTLAAMATPWTFGLVNGGPQPALWSLLGYTFDLAGSHVDFRSPTALVISGTGIVSHAGFDDTPMSWEFTTQNAGGGGGIFFSFSANANSQGVPDGGATVMLLGGALGALGLLRRFIPL